MVVIIIIVSLLLRHILCQTQKNVWLTFSAFVYKGNKEAAHVGLASLFLCTN